VKLRSIVVCIVLASGALALAGCSTGISGMGGGPPTIKAAPTVETSSWPTKCVHGSVSLSVVHLQNPAICLWIGTTLTLTFDKRHQGIGEPGPWSVPPVSSLSPSIASVLSRRKSGDFLKARTHADAVGSTSIEAYFDQECSEPDSSPCTIPPATWFTVPVKVVEPTGTPDGVTTTSSAQPEEGTSLSTVPNSVQCVKATVLVTARVEASPVPVCLMVGGKLIVTLPGKSSAGSGLWAGPAESTDSSIVDRTSTSDNGGVFISQFTAVGVGSTIIHATYAPCGAITTGASACSLPVFNSEILVKVTQA
jgi:hypothetical protein